MNRSPAFQFYPDDFLGGTFDLSPDEVGCYVRLLCHQWNRGSIPVQTEKQHRLAGGPVSPEVIAKFSLCEDGQLRNQRLEFEREKQRKYREQQADKGRRSGETRREQRFNRSSTVVEPTHEPNMNSPSPSPSPSPDVLINVHPSEEKPPKREPHPSLDAVKLACAKAGIPESDAIWFWNKCEGNGWQNGGKPIKSFAHTLASWKAAGYLPSQKQPAQRSGHSAPLPERAKSLIDDSTIRKL